MEDFKKMVGVFDDRGWKVGRRWESTCPPVITRILVMQTIEADCIG